MFRRLTLTTTAVAAMSAALFQRRKAGWLGELQDIREQALESPAGEVSTAMDGVTWPEEQPHDASDPHGIASLYADDDPAPAPAAPAATRWSRNGKRTVSLLGGGEGAVGSDPSADAVEGAVVTDDAAAAAGSPGVEVGAGPQRDSSRPTELWHRPAPSDSARLAAAEAVFFGEAAAEASAAAPAGRAPEVAPPLVPTAPAALEAERSTGEEPGSLVGSPVGRRVRRDRPKGRRTVHLPTAEEVAEPTAPEAPATSAPATATPVVDGPDVDGPDVDAPDVDAPRIETPAAADPVRSAAPTPPPAPIVPPLQEYRPLTEQPVQRAGRNGRNGTHALDVVLPADKVLPGLDAKLAPAGPVTSSEVGDQVLDTSEPMHLDVAAGGLDHVATVPPEQSSGAPSAAPESTESAEVTEPAAIEPEVTELPETVEGADARAEQEAVSVEPVEAAAAPQEDAAEFQVVTPTTPVAVEIAADGQIEAEGARLRVGGDPQAKAFRSATGILVELAQGWCWVSAASTGALPVMIELPVGRLTVDHGGTALAVVEPDGSSFLLMVSGSAELGRFGVTVPLQDGTMVMVSAEGEPQVGKATPAEVEADPLVAQNRALDGPRPV